MKTKSTNPEARKQIFKANLYGWISILFTWALCGLWFFDPFDFRQGVWQIVCSVAACGIFLLVLSLRRVSPDELSHYDHAKHRSDKATDDSDKNTGDTAKPADDSDKKQDGSGSGATLGFLTIIAGLGWLIDRIICGGWISLETFLQLGWWILLMALDGARDARISEAARLLDESNSKPKVLTPEERRKNEEQKAERRSSKSSEQQEPQKTGSRFELPAKPGQRTPYDADILAKWPCPVSTSLMYGFPGETLNVTGTSKSSRTDSQLGILNFAKVLDHLDLLGKFATFWSLRAPSADSASGADFDCAVITGSKVVLLDIKYYEQGDVLWRLEDRGRLVAIDSYTEQLLGTPLELPHNMRQASSVVKNWSAFKGIEHQVLAMVVFMPTDRGIGTIATDTVWPGDVPVLPLEKALWELQSDPPILREDPATKATIRMFKSLLRTDSNGEEAPLNSRGGKPASSDEKPLTSKPTLRRYVSKPNNEPMQVATPMPNAVPPSQPKINHSSLPSASGTSEVSGPLSFGSGRRLGVGPGFAQHGRESAQVSDKTICQYCDAEKESPVHACSNCGL